MRAHPTPTAKPKRPIVSRWTPVMSAVAPATYATHKGGEHVQALLVREHVRHRGALPLPSGQAIVRVRASSGLRSALWTPRRLPSAGGSFVAGSGPDDVFIE